MATSGLLLLGRSVHNELLRACSQQAKAVVKVKKIKEQSKTSDKHERKFALFLLLSSAVNGS